MYSERWLQSQEITGMEITITNAKDDRATPPETLMAQEAINPLTALLNQAATEDERRFVELAEVLLDSAWQFPTGKALRGELRRLWKNEDRTEWGFYKAFHTLAARRTMA